MEFPHQPLGAPSYRFTRRSHIKGPRRTIVPSAPLLLILLLLFLPPPCRIIPAVHSYPFGAGGCAGGQAAVGGSHVNATERPIIRSSALGDGGFIVSIGGVDLVPSSGSNQWFELNTDYEIAVRATEFAYKGCLVRLEALDGQDTSAALLPGLNTGMASVCEAPVVGISHVLPTFKQLHTGTIRLSEPGQVSLDVTIVGLNNETASLYAYDGYQIQFGAPPTAAPVIKSPTQAPAEMVWATREPAALSPTTSGPVAGAVATPAPSLAPLSKTNAPTTKRSPPVTAGGGTPVEQTIDNMQLQLRGVSRAFTVLEVGEWESLTEKWFDNFYNDSRGSPTSSDQQSRRHVQQNQNYGVVVGTMSSVIRVVTDTYDDQNGGVYTILYSHNYKYQERTTIDNSDETALGPLQYSTLPFRSRQGNDDYSQILKTSMPTVLGGLETPVDVPSIGAPTEEADESLSGGAIAGICVGVLLGVLAVRWLYQGHIAKKENQRAAAAVLGAESVGREALTFENGDDGNNSNNNAWLLGKEPPVESGSDTKPTALLDPAMLFTVYAPKGKLGIVLENPDYDGPIVYIIRDSSPLQGKIVVGDRLIAVDEVDVRTMSPLKISKLVAKRSANPMRKLTMLKAQETPENEVHEAGGENQQQDSRKGEREEEKEADIEVDSAVVQARQSRMSEISAARVVCVDQSFDSSEKSAGNRSAGLESPEETPEITPRTL